jgi:hypothetical protein
LSFGKATAESLFLLSSALPHSEQYKIKRAGMQARARFFLEFLAAVEIERRWARSIPNGQHKTSAAGLQACASSRYS